MTDDRLQPEADAVKVVPAPARPFPVGTPVCVWSHFLGTWTGGFTVAEVLPDGYRLLRLSDCQVLGDVFTFEEVMSDRRRNPR